MIVAVDACRRLLSPALYIEEIVGATPPGHPDRVKYVNELATLLQLRYEDGNDINDLQQSIAYH